MLTSFTIQRTFCNRSTVRVSLYVAPADHASVTVTRDRVLISAPIDVPVHDVATPEKAEAWIGRRVADPREAGAVISWLELLALEPAKQGAA